jgi:hypothetical protein
MKGKVNVYWAIDDRVIPSLALLASSPDSVIFEFAKNNKNHEYTKCPAFIREYNNTFSYKSLYDFEIDIDPETIEPTDKSTTPPQLFVRNKTSKHFSLNPHIIFFSDESLEMSQIPSSLHMNNFTDNTNVFSGRYDIGKWFRPLNVDFILRTPNIKVKKGDPLFYLKFNTDKKVNFINFKFNIEIEKIMNSCINLKFIQPGYNFKKLYNLFLQIGYRKKLLKEIKSNLVK